MMPDYIDRVQSELASLGYQTWTRDSQQGIVVEFDYQVEIGTHRGEEFRIGVSFQDTGYPEYPPHWIHVSPPIDDGRGRSTQCYTTDDGRVWTALSRPSSDIWDNLPVKNMKNYLDEHIRRFWSQL